MLSVEATRIYLIVQSLIIIKQKTVGKTESKFDIHNMNIVHFTIERESEMSQAIISQCANLS